MTTRCKETAGLLFPRKCDQGAIGQCVRCQKPICPQHQRVLSDGPYCIACLREGMRDRQHRGNLRHLADDPHFYWYFHSEEWFESGFTAQDYALFDGTGVDFDAGFDHDWGGS